jgi:hypothetical protein
MKLLIITDVTEEIFKVGSTAPAAFLFDALDHFEVRNVNSIINFYLNIRPYMSILLWSFSETKSKSR